MTQPAQSRGRPRPPVRGRPAHLPPTAGDRARALLPQGGLLEPERWRRRHGWLVGILALGATSIPGVAAIASGDVAYALLLATLLVALAGVGLVVRRPLASAAVSFGLAAAPSAVFAASGGAPEISVLYVIALGVVVLYQDWPSYLLALATAFGGAVVLVLAGGEAVVANDVARDQPLLFLGLHLLLLLGASVLHVVLWRESEREQQVGEESMRELVEVQRTMLERMSRTEELKDSLLAVVSHEFRTPLTAIIGFAQTLRYAAAGDRLPTEMVALSADRIERNGLRLSRLIGNMLAATMDIEPHLEREHAVHEVIDQIVTELSSSTDDVTPVSVDIPEDLTALMSRDHLRLLLGNLVDNGMKFADPDTTLRITGAEAGDEVVLVFTNHGPEIPESMREQIFARFVQVDLSDTRTYDGVGLGLHVVRKLCDAYGGGLELRCQDGLVVLGVTVPGGHAQRPATTPARR